MNIRKLLAAARAGYRLLVAGAGWLPSPFLLAVRLYWGWSFYQTGKGKLQSHEQVTEFFTSLHLPLPGLNAWLAGATECFGGLLLIAGLASRLTALPLIVTMIVAYLTADLEAVKAIFSDPDKFTGATPFLFLMASLLVLIFGPGAFSLDRLIARTFGFQPEPVRRPGSTERQTSGIIAGDKARAVAG